MSMPKLKKLGISSDEVLLKLDELENVKKQLNAKNNELRKS